MAEGRRKFDREFKMETARLVVEGGRKVSDIAQDFDIHENVLRKWKNQYIEDRAGQVFPYNIDTLLSGSPLKFILPSPPSV